MCWKFIHLSMMFTHYLLLNNNYNIFDLNNTIKSFHTSAVIFTMELLDKINISKKYVVEIRQI